LYANSGFLSLLGIGNLAPENSLLIPTIEKTPVLSLDRASGQEPNPVEKELAARLGHKIFFPYDIKEGRIQQQQNPS
jgi:hypothetical protein